jgi:hypothetical protein
LQDGIVPPSDKKSGIVLGIIEVLQKLLVVARRSAQIKEMLEGIPVNVSQSTYLSAIHIRLRFQDMGRENRRIIYLSESFYDLSAAAGEAVHRYRVFVPCK